MQAITTGTEYQAALQAIDDLMLAEANTKEGEKLDALVRLVEAYEAKAFAKDLEDIATAKAPF